MFLFRFLIVGTRWSLTQASATRPATMLDSNLKLGAKQTFPSLKCSVPVFHHHKKNNWDVDIVLLMPPLSGI